MPQHSELTAHITGSSNNCTMQCCIYVLYEESCVHCHEVHNKLQMGFHLVFYLPCAVQLPMRCGVNLDCKNQRSHRRSTQGVTPGT